jgi:hypothetical protein
MKHLDEASQRQISQERAENYVESIFMHTGEAIETFVNYFELDFEHGVISPTRGQLMSTDDVIPKLSNGELLSVLLSHEFSQVPDYALTECTQELRRRVYQLAQQHGVIDKMVEKVANDIYNSDF